MGREKKIETVKKRERMRKKLIMLSIFDNVNISIKLVQK